MRNRTSDFRIWWLASDTFPTDLEITDRFSSDASPPRNTSIHPTHRNKIRRPVHITGRAKDRDGCWVVRFLGRLTRTERRFC